MKSFLLVDFLPTAHEAGLPAGPAELRHGQDLKSMFDNLTAGPMPDCLLQLAYALEEAFQRGDLFDPKAKLDA